MYIININYYEYKSNRFLNMLHFSSLLYADLKCDQFALSKTCTHVFNTLFYDCLINLKTQKILNRFIQIQLCIITSQIRLASLYALDQSMPRKISGFEIIRVHLDCTYLLRNWVKSLMNSAGLQLTFVGTQKKKKTVALQHRPFSHYSVRRKYQCATFSYFFFYQFFFF